jgi:hypothetical protein
MSRIAIKICGLSTPETLDAALKGGASHVGFVHFAKSPRHVDGDRLAQLAARVPVRRPLVAETLMPLILDLERLRRRQGRPRLPGEEMDDLSRSTMSAARARSISPSA